MGSPDGGRDPDSTPRDPASELLSDARAGGRYGNPARPHTRFSDFPASFPSPSCAPWSLSITADGSPTLAHGAGEAMHNAAGALSETCYVYGPLAGAVARGAVAPHAVVVGLGLGYVEILIACACVARGNTTLAESLRIQSFEADPLLRDAFRAFVSRHPPHAFVDTSPGAMASSTADPPRTGDTASGGTVAAHLAAVHEGVLRACAALHGVPPADVLDFLRRGFFGAGLELRGALHPGEPHTLPDAGYGALFFDAYSEATSAPLWDEAFLDALMGRAARRCLFATYASRTALKKRLRANGFTMAPRRGFAGKRECTLAWRCE